MDYPQTEVCLYLYDQQIGSIDLNKIKTLNDVSRFLGFGVFFSSLVLYNREISYDSQLGINIGTPKSLDGLSFRESIKLGKYDKGHEAIVNILSKLVDKYQSSQYHIFKKNCHHFVKELTHLLIKVEVPSFINTLNDFIVFFSVASFVNVEDPNPSDKKDVFVEYEALLALKRSTKRFFCSSSEECFISEFIKDWNERAPLTKPTRNLTFSTFATPFQQIEKKKSPEKMLVKSSDDLMFLKKEALESSVIDINKKNSLDHKSASPKSIGRSPHILDYKRTRWDLPRFSPSQKESSKGVKLKSTSSYELNFVPHKNSNELESEEEDVTSSYTGTKRKYDVNIKKSKYAKLQKIPKRTQLRRFQRQYHEDSDEEIFNMELVPHDENVVTSKKRKTKSIDKFTSIKSNKKKINENFGPYQIKFKSEPQFDKTPIDDLHSSTPGDSRKRSKSENSDNMSKNCISASLPSSPKIKKKE